MEEEQKSYKEEISELIEEQLQKGGIRNGDFKFYNVERLIRIADMLDYHEAKCQDCRYHKKELNELAGNLHYYLNTSNKTRKTFEQKHDRLASHLKKQHGVVTAGYSMHLHTFFGILLGLVAGYLATFMQGGETMKLGLLIGAAAGLILGRSYGMRIEARKRKANKVL